jgi:hypothetical protein
MPTKEKWLDHMQSRLSKVCEAQNWDLKQTSALETGTRSFVVNDGSKNLTVLLSSLVCTRIHANAIFEYDDIEYDEAMIRTVLARKFDEVRNTKHRKVGQRFLSK